MTLKGKLSSFISACNELSIFIFNHKDINVKLLVKSLLRGGRGGKPLQPHRFFLLCFCVNLLKEPKLGVASAHCLGFPWGWPATLQARMSSDSSFSLFLTLPWSVIREFYHLGWKTYFYSLLGNYTCLTLGAMTGLPTLMLAHWRSFFTWKNDLLRSNLDGTSPLLRPSGGFLLTFQWNGAFKGSPHALWLFLNHSPSFPL